MVGTLTAIEGQINKIRENSNVTGADFGQNDMDLVENTAANTKWRDWNGCASAWPK